MTFFGTKKKSTHGKIIIVAKMSKRICEGIGEVNFQPKDSQLQFSRQEISTCLKYTVFSFNFIVFVSIFSFNDWSIMKNFEITNIHELIKILLNGKVIVEIIHQTLSIEYFGPYLKLY